MSTSSDHEMCEESNSPQTFIKESPQSSPSQQVPQLTNCLTELTCADTYQSQNIRHCIGPILRIIEQPQNHFRFRYVSEMVGTHGCLLGKSSTSKNKTHPTVELVNYNGEAIIRCRLAQYNVEEDHPHKLLEDEQDRDVSYRVPEQGSYKVGFAGMGIIHTAKKDVSGILFKKMSEKCKNLIYKDLRAHCDNKAKTINLNIVRLRFSAHDPLTGGEICEAVYSDPIHNMKSAATNDLKICRISRITGRSTGGEDIYLLVEKVNKKNIEIHIYELDKDGNKFWSARGHFTQNDVHHQYAIVFRTPPYKDPHTAVDVKVWIELVRPSDGRVSEPVEFTYKADVYRSNKRRRVGSSYSSIDSSSGGSIKSNCGIPTTVLDTQHVENIDNYKCQIQHAIPQVGVAQPMSPNHCGLGSALSYSTGPLLGQASAHHALSQSESIIDFKLNSAEFEKLLRNDTDLDPSEIKLISGSEYLEEYFEHFSDLSDGNWKFSSELEFLRSPTMVPDSGRAKGKTVQHGTTARLKESEKIEVDLVPGETKPLAEYPAYYTAEDGAEVKKLVKELCDIMRNKNGYKKQLVRDKLERLFELRLSNGDTFLHMTLCSNQTTLEYIVKIIHNVRMTHLLDYANSKQQTALHIAVANDTPQMVALLVKKGCNPMAKDHEEHNAVHYAVKYQSCLEVLLDTISKHNVPCDLNAYNSEKQTALHLAAIAGCEASTRALLRHGAGYSVRDTEGRTPLHLAAYDDRLAVARALLDHMPPSDVDVIDGRGNTALQIVCSGSVRENTIEIGTLLLQKKADPLRHEKHNRSAWQLAHDKPALRDALRPHAGGALEDDVKSEPEDEYESADDAEAEDGLREMELYSREVSAALDASGAWRALAARVRLDALLAWYAAQPSPTATLLNHLKESRDDITSKTLALILDDIGQHDAASIIRRYIN